MYQLLRNYLFNISVLRGNLLPTAFFSLLIAISDSLGVMVIIPLLFPDEANNGTVWVQWVHENVGSELVDLILLIIAAFCMKFVAVSLALVYSNKAFLQAELELKLRLAKGFAQVSWNWLQGNDAARVSNIYTNEMYQTMSGFKAFIEIISTLVLVGFYLLASIVLDYRALLLTGFTGVFLFLLQRLASRYIGQRSENLSRLNILVQRGILELANGIKYLKSTAQGHLFTERLKGDEKRRRSEQFRLLAMQHVTSAFGEPLGIAVAMSYIWLNVVWYENSLGSSLLPLFFVYRSLGRFNQLQSLWARSSSVSGPTRQVSQLLSELENNPEEVMGKDVGRIQQGISFSDVSYAYGSSDKPTVDALNLDFPKGKITAIVGRSGAGKTTILDLLMGLCRPSSGQIAVDGNNLSGLDMDRLRSRLGYMTQDIFLFSSSVTDNITMFTGNTGPQFDEAMNLSHCDDFIGPGKEIDRETRIGTDGVSLSGGQAQRLAMAREILRDIDMLVLDESTSALDLKTEAILADGLAELKSRMGVVLIAHRLNLVRKADYIYLLDKGQVVASGDWDSLFAESEAFRDFVRLQRDLGQEGEVPHS